METLESSRVCRLCGKQSGISINIFDKNENHVKKINAVLPIMVHEMDLLPKHMCHRCSYKLEEFHKFYVDCLKTDAHLKSQLSWMRTEAPKERVGIPMVHIENFKIKIEPLDYDAYDINTIDDNVNYINSMNSVTYQSNDLPYATYARCRCCCDKMDQSNQTVPTNYETTKSSRCNRLDDVEASDGGLVNESQAVKKNLIKNKTCQGRSSLPTPNKKNNKDTGNNRSTSSFDYVNDGRTAFNVNKEVSKTTIVRNLRPRKNSVDYAETKKKTSVKSLLKSEKLKAPSQQSIFDTTWIKTEKMDDFEGRTLRPRKETIYYWGGTRKYTKSTDKNQRTQNDVDRTNKEKVRNIASKLQLPSRKVRKVAEDRIKVTIKEEQISDLDDTVIDKPTSFLTMTKDCKALNSSGKANKIDALPTDFLNVQNDRVNCSIFNNTQQDIKFSINDLSFPKYVATGKLKPGKVNPNQNTESYLPKCLRSHDLNLRNGKIRKVGSTRESAKKLRKTLRNMTDTGESIDRDAMKTITDIVSTQKISTLIKLNDSNIKHYCEECNMRFLNKELLKLHACYR
ncbi:uncharacterized protein LOC143183848 [Calliopsis andreniformis]|uniref:uncharacterized protein LOC143183848 n=1 Tax=Calliopsis andreniformis TaxID=337506 RepID=UPI003FCE8F64